MNEKKLLNKNVLAIAVCWLVYTCSYLGKLGYNANIILIEREFGVAHAESGSVGTAFFFAYGAGQIINGLLCKKYKVKYTIFLALIVSAVCNFTLTIIIDFAWLKIVWLINGAALSFLWSLLIRFLSETLDSKYTSKAVVIMGTTVAVGTFAVYGLSALFAAISVYKAIFYLAAVLLPTIAIIWFLSFKAISQTQNTKDRESAPTVDKEESRFRVCVVDNRNGDIRNRYQRGKRRYNGVDSYDIERIVRHARLFKYIIDFVSAAYCGVRNCPRGIFQ